MSIIAHSLGDSSSSSGGEGHLLVVDSVEEEEEEEGRVAHAPPFNSLHTYTISCSFPPPPHARYRTGIARGFSLSTTISSWCPQSNPLVKVINRIDRLYE